MEKQPSSSGGKPAEGENELSVREQLGMYYNLDGEMPIPVTEAILQTTQKHMGSTKKMPKHISATAEGHLISKMFQNTMITPEQKELLAKAVLEGNYDIEMDSDRNEFQTEQQNNHTRMNLSKSQQINAYINRHSLGKPRFLEVVPEAANIPVVSPKQVHESRMAYLRSIPRPDFKHEPLPRVTPQLAASKGRQSRIAEEKIKAVKKAKEESRKKTEDGEKRRHIEHQTLLKKAEIKRQLTSFRHKLKEHLEAKKEPMIGSIMRCVDESMIYYFMEKFDGYSMTADAIMALIGNALSSKMVEPDPQVLPENQTRGLTATEAMLRASYAAQQLRMQQELNKKEFGVEGSVMNDSIRSSYQTSEVNFGIKAPPVHRVRGAHKHLHALETGDSSPALFYHERHWDHIQPVQQIRMKTAGSGFRLKTPYDGHRSSSPHSASRSLSPVDRGIKRPPGPTGTVPVVSAPSLEDTSRTLTANAEHLLLHGSTVPGQESHSAPPTYDAAGFAAARRDRKHLQEQMELRGSLGSVEDAISAMHEQLVEERILPSLAPEKILTDQQITDLGMKNTTADAIMNSMAKKPVKKKSLSHRTPEGKEKDKKKTSTPVHRALHMTTEELQALDKELEESTSAKDEDDVSMSSNQTSSANNPLRSGDDYGGDSVKPSLLTLKSSRGILNNNESSKSGGGGGAGVSISLVSYPRDLTIKVDTSAAGGRGGVYAQAAAMKAAAVAAADDDDVTDPGSRTGSRNGNQSGGRIGNRAGGRRQTPTVAGADDNDSRGACSRGSNNYQSSSERDYLDQYYGHSTMSAESPPPSAVVPPFFNRTSDELSKKFNSDELPMKSPVAIKTQTKYESRDGFEFLPVSPFKSYDSRQQIHNSGVPAGAGLMIWPRVKHTATTRTGRYRVGSVKRATDSQKFVQRPFVPNV